MDYLTSEGEETMTCRAIFRYHSGTKRALNTKSRYTEKVSLKIRGEVEFRDLKSTYYFFVCVSIFLI